VARYDVDFHPIVPGGGDADWGSTGFKVDDPAGGLFSLGAIPAGAWRMRVRRGPGGVAGWGGTGAIAAGRAPDRGARALQRAGKRAVRIVDETGAPAVDAEIRVVTADDARPVEFAVVRGYSRQTSVRTTPRSGDLELELVSGKVRVEVRSDGYATAGADVEVPPSGKPTCTITLQSPESS